MDYALWLRRRLSKASAELGMISPYVVGLLLILIALAQTTLSPRLLVMGAQPNLMLLSVVSWSLLRGERQGMLWAFVGGALIDLLSGAPLGVSSLSLLLVSFLAGLGATTIFRASLSLLLLIGLGSSLFHDAIFLALLQIMGWPVNWPVGLWRLMLPSAGLNMICMPVVYASMRWIHRRIRGGELGW
jgi:rod shape-determining protein MreD